MNEQNYPVVGFTHKISSNSAGAIMGHANVMMFVELLAWEAAKHYEQEDYEFLAEDAKAFARKIHEEIAKSGYLDRFKDDAE